MTRASSASSTARRLLVGIGVAVGLHVALAGPAAAQPIAAAPATGACHESRGLRAIFNPVDKIRCVLGIGDEQKRTEEVEQAAAVRPARAAAPAGWGPMTATPRGAVIPVDPPAATTDCTPSADLPIPSMVASIFRCRLAEAGLPADQVRYLTAEAVTVAECESLFDPSAVVFNGRYLHSAHPSTGMRYSAAGVFQFIRSTAEKWIDGGYANVHDPVKNIDAAARLMINNIRLGVPSWGDWACAAANDGFAHASVLPGWPGGPGTLPDWAHRF